MNPSRRAVALTAAWSAPVVALAAAAPAFAASLRKDPGINGWVNVNYGTQNGFNATFDSDPSGTDPATPDGAPFGLYVYDVNVAQNGTVLDVLTGASVTLWFRGTVTSWDEGSGSNAANGGGHGNAWSNPISVGTQTKLDNLQYHGYRFDYTGPFVRGTDGRVYLQDFEITAQNVRNGDATFWVERKITVNGVQQAFQRRNGERGPLGGGFPSTRRAAGPQVAVL